MDQGKAIAAIGLVVAALVVAAAVGLGFWQAKVGCEDFARREHRELVENRWFAKGNYCVTRDAEGVTHESNETWPFMFLVVIASIPLGMAAGGGAIGLCGSARARLDDRAAVSPGSRS